jgi:hypothetical protein
MKKTILPLALLLTGASLMAQIPNPSFEVWQTETRNLPEVWRTFGSVTKVNGFTGSHAVKLQAIEDGNDGPPGAVLLGNPPEGSQIFTGGIPFNARPDSVVGWFRFNHVPEDSSVLILQMRASGNIIADHWIRFTGAPGSWQRRAFKVNYTGAGNADTLVIGVTSTNFISDTIRAQSWLEVDNLHFTGGSGTIPALPNFSFENWADVSLHSPSRWRGEEEFGNPYPRITQTTDAARGNYAIRLRNYVMGADERMGGYTGTVRDENSSDINWGEPAFPVSQRHDSLYFYAKYDAQNGDSGLAAITFFKNGMMMGDGYRRIPGTNNQFQLFAIVADYWTMDAPDSATIMFASFDWQTRTGEPNGNSVLIVDEVSFTKPWGLDAKRFAEVGIRMYPNPAKSALTLELDAAIRAGENVEIRDMNGRLMSRHTPEMGVTQIKLELGSLSAGYYLIRVNRLDGAALGRVLIQP